MISDSPDPGDESAVNDLRKVVVAANAAAPLTRGEFEAYALGIRQGRANVLRLLRRELAPLIQRLK